ncbi:MAG: CHC2 zinc finger domain-containing protein, partial [Patescibacteria group bacterium]
MSSPVEQIKSRLNLTDVIQSYVKLQKAGSNFKANCPFHNEKTPSFFVSPAREVWHCFGCGAGGDLIEFVKKIEGVEFPEALQMLADRAGVELKKEDPRLRSERVRLFKLLEAAVGFYESQLEENGAAREYLAGRGLKSETIKNFRVGYAPDAWQEAADHLRVCGFTDAEI